MADDVVTMDKIVSLCKRRGIIFSASEIYGGIANTYDYGHYGVLLKRNVVDAWWQAMIGDRDDIVALDSAIIQHPRTWEASGHLAGFTDPLVDCRTCKQRFRADHLDAEHDVRCPRKPSVLPGDARRKPPFGIAQIGKSFRNEITPGNFIFRTLEFEQMEMEFFVPPDDAQRWYQHWLEARLDWYESLGNRGDFDLTQHATHSGDKLEYFDQQTGERYVPHVIEPAAGLGRSVLALLCDAYDEDEIGGEKRTVLKLHPKIAPVKVAVLPLVRKDGQPELARDVRDALRGRMQTEYDEGGSIGRRYRRQDEIGTPYCVTIDHQSLEDRTVTVRERDSLAQDRVAVDELPDVLEARLEAPWES